ncbi:uncharacterized protein LOC111908545 [Lactuca sativa]|uniref:J domain-containing protein n=1 Tax=Lactuca sativa TaxID=4236 RepID=A0A9R1X5Q9_LACSA|nr:uncharacterized protein LOC111908545 [Lactuca sativa]KAJ0199614.1 hypothetical protein LSAT_V11C600327320 [Lactuca sativa]
MTPKSTIRLITYSNELINGDPLYISSNSLPIKASNYEPAGHSFHDIALKLRGYFEEENITSDNETLPKDKEHDYMQSSDSYSSSKGKKKTADGVIQQDHYALLGLGHLRYLATEEQIRKSYRETALKHHPDKQAALLLGEETEAGKQAKKDEIENRFKAIQEAYEVLIDSTRRRIYDSTDEFDDEIPTDCSPNDFFKVFGPAFMRNGRWSVVQPIPPLGDDTMPLKEVDSFYDFWYGFKSWREFPHDEEFDLEQAESRDHKRWMERQNAKLSEKARKEEHARIRSLVDNAYKRDPRIMRRKETLKLEKQKKKEAKFIVKKQQEEEAAKVAEENRKKKEEEDKQAAEAASNQKKIKEKEKKLLRKERTRLRTISSPVVSENILNLSSDDVESICMKLDMLQLKKLCDDFEGQDGNNKKAELLKSALSVGDQQSEKEKDSVVKKNQVNGSIKVNGSLAQKKEKPWGKEEIELLRKGIVKYPKGTSRRWEVVAEYIGTGRSVEEILKATKTVLLQKPDSAKAFDSFLEKRKPAVSIASPLTTREEVDGVSVSVSVGPTESQPQPSQSEEAGSSGSDQDVWTPVQETALVQALKTFPKEINQRWERVAAAVPGKTVNQCKKQFALLKEKFRNKKK